MLDYYDNDNPECLNHQPYKLVLTDNNMLEMTGIEAAREIRRLKADG
jgi:CheY-like chemotaxis protein